MKQITFKTVDIKHVAFLISTFIFSFVLLVMRRPDIIFSAQPWAEDGVVWMQNIHNNGLFSTIFLPQNGYYQSISKISYSIGLLLGLENAALVANIIAISIRSAMCVFLLSNRMSQYSLVPRIAIVLYFILMPNIAEGYINITNAQWYLAMYLSMILVAKKAESIADVIHDYIILVIAGLSGPFIVFIAPSLIIKRIIERNGFINALRNINAFDITAAAICIIQIIAILFTSDENRVTSTLGASFQTLAQIISYRVILGTFLYDAQSLWLVDNIPLMTGMFVLLTAAVIVAILKQNKTILILSPFPIIMFAFALAKPMISAIEPQWPILLQPGAGERYFFITNVFFFAFIIYLLTLLGKFSNVIIAILAAVLIPIAATYASIQPLPDLGYDENIKKYYKINNGEYIDININPKGWVMRLYKK